MKNKILIVFVFIGGLINAQLSVSKIDGTPLTDGQVITFNSVVYDDALLELKITNNSSSSIDVKLKCISFTNTDGSQMGVCFGPNCFTGVTSGQLYPSASTNVAINAGGSDTTSHFANADPGNGSSNIDYVFQIYRTNSFGGVVGTPFTFTYRYNPNLANTNFGSKAIGMDLKSSVVTSNIELNATNDVNLQMLDMNGRLVREANLVSGYQNIDVSDLSSGIYILNCSNSEGKKANFKIVKK